MRSVPLAAAAVFLTLFSLPSSAAPAAPLPPDSLSRSDLTLVADGCGAGGHRVPQGFCVFNRGPYYRHHGYYRPYRHYGYYGHHRCWTERTSHGYRRICR